jgi:hypothetical protein
LEPTHFETEGHKLTEAPPLKLTLKQGEGDRAIRVDLRNISRRDVTVNATLTLTRFPLFDWLAPVFLEVITPSRGEVSWSYFPFVDWRSPRPEYFVTLGPEECCSLKEELPETYYMFFDEIGWYEITVEYQNTFRGEQFGPNAWVGSLKSNTLKIYNDKICPAPFKMGT